ncbi:monovalent cation/H+ antiporter subunit D [uncultured Amaricoccus sp.]|uniref:monovalent cation/H+ antiporter subunit D n=1 Tax=uncultured Amaricoccus sp. TaxID=339341 RepID=UPI002608880E|nr:monovalent cation/H+ antiporter subunit D [uncultured Amaricoccus sp.]
MKPEHLLVAPILIPLFAGALMLFYKSGQHRTKRIISLVSSLALLIVAVQLVGVANDPPGQAGVATYLLGNWAPPFAIVLVVDRLSALMLLLTAVLALPALVFASARWDGRGQHFHSQFQFLLMGMNGAFLTGDLFNLFVFFEVMLAASYGLMLHGSGTLRVRAALHYIAVNLTASLCFLIGVAILYGVTGTLNMADLAVRVAELDAARRPLLLAGASILGVAFLVKAAMWPVCFWLPVTYVAAAPPVAAIFAGMSKVGFYVILRLSMLVFPAGVGPAGGFGAHLLVAGGFATLAFGMIGVLASQGLGRVAGCFVIVSSGTLLLVTGMIGLGGPGGLLAGGLYYMISSTLAISALYLIIEIVERDQSEFASILAVTAEAYGFMDEGPEDADQEIGIALPVSVTILALAFGACALLLAGLPPLSGFVGKLAMLSAAFNPSGMAAGGRMPPLALAFSVMVILSGLAAMIALTRVGIQTFWAADEQERPPVALVEILPVLALLLVALGVTARAEPVLRYMDATVADLRDPGVYIAGVRDAPRVIRGEEGAP